MEIQGTIIFFISPGFFHLRNTSITAEVWSSLSKYFPDFEEACESDKMIPRFGLFMLCFALLLIVYKVGFHFELSAFPMLLT